MKQICCFLLFETQIQNKVLSFVRNRKTKNKFISLLNICEFARYSPSRDRNEQMERTLENAKEIIIEVESDMKEK